MSHSAMPFHQLSLSLLLTVVCVARLALSEKNDFHIPPERVKSLLIQACTYERPSVARNERNAAIYPLPSGNKLKWCLTLHTNKGTAQLEQDLKRTTQLAPVVSLSWRRLSTVDDTLPECRVKFKGYQREYRLAPGLGHYQECQQDISRYTNLLSKTRNQTLNAPYINIKDDCPLQELPASFEAYRACDLMPEHWYQLHFRSSIRAEVNENKQYRQFWFNHTQTFVFKPYATTQTDGSQREWLGRVVTIKLSVQQCDAKFLIEKDNDWPHNVALLGYYQYRTRTHMPEIFRLGNLTIANTTLSSASQPWISGTFPLQKATETDRNQLCLNITSNGVHYTKDVHLCRHVPVVECRASHSVPLIAIICLTALASTF